MTRRLGHRAAVLAIWTTLGLFGGMFLAVTVPYLFGDRSLTVLSGSMEPAVHVGDVVVVEQVAPLDVRVGDIVTFRDPEDASRLLTHRVRQIDVRGDDVHFVTKGDANTTVEDWKINRSGTIGRVNYHLWHLGYLMFWIRSPFGRLGMVVVPALLLGALELWRIWRPADDGDASDPLQGEATPDEAAA